MSIAKPRNESTLPLFMVRTLVIALASVTVTHSLPALAQGEPPPPKSRPDEHGKGFGPSGGGPRFGFPGGGPTDSLNEEEKKALRSAVEKVWNDAEIVAARERIMKANEELRTALRTALQKSDPDVVRILEKVKNVMPWDQHRGPPRLPRPEDPNFPRMAAARLGMEMMFMAKPEQRDAFRHLHERLVNLPVVKEAIAKIESVPVEGRWDAYKSLREIYKKECERSIAEFRAKHPDGGHSQRTEPEKAPSVIGK